MMRRSGSSVTLVCLGLLIAATAAASDEAGSEPQSFGEALKGGKPGLALRYRYEDVSDDGVDKHAQASTLRTALSYRTAAYKNWSLFVEAENVAVVGKDYYNNKGGGGYWNGVGDRPVVADPAITELNQVYGRWDDGKTQVTLGRQEILLGDVRFVGNVGWRQNHQSFDALSVTNTAIDSWTLHYSFIDAVNRIFGDTHEMAGHLANARYAWDGVGVLTLYGYVLDYDEQVALSSSTFGAELAGKRALDNGWSVLYELEAARQSDAGDNPADVDADYFHGAVGASSGKVTVKGGFEQLGGSLEDGQFQTPLATLHKFNGWADKFLTTPVGGLEDAYLQIGGNTGGGLGWLVVYHDFSAATGGASYGNETDVQLTYTTKKGLGLGFKGALFDADTHSVDTDKLMLWATYGFK